MEIIVTLGAAAAGFLAILAFWRWVVPFVRAIFADLGAFKSAVLGRDEVRHPDTGQTLVEAQPGLGSRVASIENAVVEIARTHRRLDDHEVRLARLELGIEERTAARTETVELLRVVDTALRSQPEKD